MDDGQVTCTQENKRPSVYTCLGNQLTNKDKITGAKLMLAFGSLAVTTVTSDASTTRDSDTHTHSLSSH